MCANIKHDVFYWVYQMFEFDSFRLTLTFIRGFNTFIETIEKLSEESIFNTNNIIRL